MATGEEPNPASRWAAWLSVADALGARWPRYDRVLFAVYAFACVLYTASVFYGYLLMQTGGAWSAPLDDVFIHFDYARATARGYPFHWSEGNGYSSGNTSLTYPFVLAGGYWMGFRKLDLMVWAALVAVASTVCFLLAAARLFDPLPRWAKYLLPPAALSLGALDWSLFSGMENAFHLGVWGATLVLTLRVAAAGSPRSRALRGWLAGAAGALLFLTRPESVVSIAAFGCFAALAVRRRDGGGWREPLATVVRIGLPGVLAMVGQAGLNRALTGEWSANGAIAKLALNNPYMTGEDKWNEWVFHLQYVVLRNAQHHFADVVPWGWLVPAVAVVPLASRVTRPAAALLWVQVIGWCLIVALNGQVRWQNERYTMAGVAWLYVLAALGVAVIAGAVPSAPLERAGRWIAARVRRDASAVAWVGNAARWLVAAAVVIVYARHQAPNMRDQIWFFGRASRNIRDQHLVAGRLLGQLGVRRVLVGDAGGLLYTSDRPGLDLIGLGGYHDLPFARAGVHGLGASLELIERMPVGDRPDHMAIYPTWWGDLPAIFGRRLTEVPVVGNVICGGAEKVIYRADWSPLDREGTPRSLRPGERILDQLDVADLVSERAHRYVFPGPRRGFVELRVLADPAAPARDLFDAGRLIPTGSREVATLEMPTAGGRLVARTALGRAAVVEVLVDGARVGELRFDRPWRRGDPPPVSAMGPASDVPARKLSGWIEAEVLLPPGLSARAELALVVREGEWVNHHVWSIAGPSEPRLERDGAAGGAARTEASSAPR